MGKILLVEDDNNLREIYGARLQAEGHEIISARDGEEALAIAVKEKPDLIIADIMMPRVSGFDMLDILRNAPETKNTKIIMMTALSQQEDKEHAEKLGADKYLVKSQVTLEDVAKVVRETLGGSKADDKNEPAQADTPKPAEPSAQTSGGASADKPQPAEPPKPDEPVKPADSPKPADPPKPTGPPTGSATPAPEPPKPADPPKPPTPPAPPAPANDKPAKPSMGTPPTGNGNSPASDDKPSAPGSSVSIPVTGPPQDSAAQATGGDSADKPKPADDTTKKDDAKPAGSDLAQTLADEEKQIKDQIKDFEKKPTGPAPASPINPSGASMDDQTPADKDDEDDESKSETAGAASAVSDGSANPRKVIKPINDLSKKTDLAALAAKEEAKSEGDTTNHQQNIVKPQTPIQPNSPAQAPQGGASEGKDKPTEGTPPEDGKPKGISI